MHAEHDGVKTVKFALECIKHSGNDMMAHGNSNSMDLSTLSCHVNTYEQMLAGFDQCDARDQLPVPPQLGPAAALSVLHAVPLQQHTCC